MRADHYFDLEVRRGTDLNVPDALSLALRVIHGSAIDFALSLPDMKEGLLGERLRIFGSTVEDLVRIQDRMENGPLDDYVAIRRIKPVPEVSIFESFQTLNVKSFKSRNARRIRRGKLAYTNEDIPVIQCKNEMLNKVNFLTVTSKSSGQKFKLFITRNTNQSFNSGTPDSYGFSSPTNIISLPVFP